MQTLTQRLTHIVDESEKIRQQYLTKYQLTADYINVFCEDSNTYDFFSEETLKIGTLLKETHNGIYVLLNQPLNIKGYEIKTLKIRKPDSSKTTDGSLDFVTNDYNALRDQLQSNDQFTLSVNTFKQEEIIVTYKDTDAYVAINTISILDTIQPAEANSDSSDLTIQLEEEKGRRLQLMSDFQNYQKRVESEKALYGAMASMGLIQEMLEIFDDLNLALTDENLNLDHAKASMKSAQDKLVSAVERAGVERLEVKVGDEFDKEKMEAVSIVAAGDDKKGKVVAVISSAFKYRDKEGILKAAKVVVGK